MSFSIIGLDNNEAVEYLESGSDICFGRSYAKSVFDCINCRAPVIKDGKIYLMKEICATKCAGRKDVSGLRKLTSREVMELVEKGVSLAMIFRMILADCPPEQQSAEARQVLVDRAAHLKTIGLDLGKIPRTTDLLEASK